MSDWRIDDEDDPRRGRSYCDIGREGVAAARRALEEGRSEQEDDEDEGDDE